TALASATEAAQSVVRIAQDHRQNSNRRKPVFAVWVGEDPAASEAFESAAIPHFSDESHAVEGFMHLVRYGEVQESLMAAPPSLPTDFAPDVAAARDIVQSAVRAARTWLDPIEITQLLSAYSIPAAPAVLARDPDEAKEMAAPLLAQGGTVVAKILSPDIVHKSE